MRHKSYRHALDSEATKMPGTFRRLCSVSGLLAALLISSSARPSDCGQATHDIPQSKQHTYYLTVTSPTGTPVRIKGAVAVSHPDQFVAIDAETPYELTVVGSHYLIIVGAAEAHNLIDFSLSIDDQVATSGSENPVYSVGDGFVPRRGGLFSANYQIRAQTE
jgi:hypothetical protein